MGTKYKEDIRYIEITEADFYPQSDNRVMQSYILDIRNGDNFADYCEYIFDLYEEEGYWD